MIIDGMELRAGIQSDQSSGQDAPTKSLEDGAEISQRNVLIPQSGTIYAAAESSEIAQLRAVAEEEDPISITTAEGTVSEVVVENVRRNREGKYTNKFDIEFEWRQVFVAEVGAGSIEAVTEDGPATEGAESQPGDDVVGSESRSTSDGATVDGGDGEGGTDGDGGSGALSPVTSIANDVAGLFS
ncbi:hypothetical protein HacjB3_05380 [Halalkalicoccus jeotgali B3]|nr:hypothetical protein HacjB3_05380 [Halalkalicoccus jeotgali B3]